jgi:hypothetical protein
MAGGGLYNAHSQPQHVAGDDGVPLLVRASEAIPLDRELGVVVADYGSSQGRNSLVPMGAVVEQVRIRLGADAPISIFHTDLPSNDFAALFTTLEADPQSYLRDAANVFAYAAGRSFYERLFPAEHVAIGWSSITVHWLSSVPVPLRNHIFSPLGDARERAAYAARAAEDWQRFLGHRLEELEQDGQLVVVGSGADENGRSGAEGLMDLANDALRELVAENRLTGRRVRADGRADLLPHAERVHRATRQAHPRRFIRARRALGVGPRRPAVGKLRAKRRRRRVCDGRR